MKKYLVALAVGGLMECPEFKYEAKQIIEAESEKEAVEIYNKKNNCYYFYGTCLGVVDENSQTVSIPIDKAMSIL